jgi:uncharacterized protein YabE (DUF348 family)
MLRRSRLRLFGLIIGLLIVAALVATLGFRKTVTLDIDGQAYTITTYALRVSDLLRSQGIALSPEDALTPPLDTWLKRVDTVSLVHAIPVQVLADGEFSTFYSADRLPSHLLEQAGVHLNTGDLLLSNSQPVEAGRLLHPDAKFISLQLVRSVSFTLHADGKTIQLNSAAPTLGSALWAAGYQFFAADQLTPPPDTPLTPGLVASLTRSQPITIQTQSGEVTTRSSASTVGGALQAAGLSLQGLDYSLPLPDDPIPSNRKISLVQVTEQVLVEQSPIPYDTQYQPDSSLDLDTQAVLQAGEYGLNDQRVRVRFEDGVEITRTIDTEWVARQPQPQIIGYGTNVVMHTTTVDGTTIQYWRSLSMYATSYHPSEVGDTTASGLPLQKGVAAVDRSLIPFYTQLYIPGYGEAVAADVGGGVIGRWIDLGYSDSDYVPWHQWVTVYFLWPPPENIVWILP